MIGLTFGEMALLAPAKMAIIVPQKPARFIEFDQGKIGALRAKSEGSAPALCSDMSLRGNMCHCHFVGHFSRGMMTTKSGYDSTAPL